MDAISPTTTVDKGRRRALAAFVNTVFAALGGTLASVLGVFALRPPAATTPGRWIRAGILKDLTPGAPVPRVLVTPRVDGWHRVRVRETVFLLWDGGRQVRAVSATCTHLGCQVHWDAKTTRFQCPCHGGEYDAEGRVIAGPPPRPLESLAVRVDPGDGSVLVQL